MNSTGTAIESFAQLSSQLSPSALQDLLTQMHQLNETHTPHVGSLERDRFEELVRLPETQTWLVLSNPVQLLGFLVVMNELTPYSSPNFLWFKERYSQFLYVDRIAVDPSVRKQGWGRRLYDQVIREAQKTHRSLVTCEVNVKPPNPESLEFHSRLGFFPLGEQDTEQGAKRVRLLGFSP